MPNIDDVILQSIVNDDSIEQFEERLSDYEGEIKEADAALINGYSEKLADRATEETFESINNYLSETVTSLENAQRIGLNNESEIRTTQEMVQRVGGDVDRVERKVDEMGMSLAYEGGYEGEEGGAPGLRGPTKGKRRDFLIGLGAVASTLSLGGIGALFYNQRDLASNLEDDTLKEREWYSFGEIENCLSDGQRSVLEDNIDQPLDETSYKFEKSGDSRSEGWDIYLADSHGQEEFAKLQGQDIYCEVK